MADLPGWSYYKIIAITGQAGAGTDYQVELEIGDSAGGDFHLEGHCTNFPQDIRITDDDGTTLLDHWVEDITADPIIVHVKVDDNLDSNQNIRVYYGKNGETTASNGTDTFLAFFDGDSTGWTEVDPNSHITFQNNRLEFDGLTRGEVAYVYKAITPIEHDWIAKWKMEITSQDIASHVFSMGISEDIDDLYSHAGDSIGFDYYKSTNNMIYVWEVDGGSATSNNDDLGALYTELYMCGTRVGDTAYFYAYSDAARTTPLGTTSIDVSDVTAANLDNYYLLSSLHATGTQAMTGYIDNHFCGKYNSPEPAFASAGAEQTSSSGTDKNYVLDTLIKSLNIDKNYVLDTLLQTSNIDKNYVIDTLLQKLNIDKDYVLDTLIKSLNIDKDYVIDTLIKSLNIDKDYVIDTLIQKLNIDKNYVIDTLIKSLNIDKDYVLDTLLQTQNIDKDYVLDTLIKSLNIDKNYVIDILLKSLDIDKNYVIDTLLQTSNIDKNYVIDTLLQISNIDKNYVIDLLIQKLNIDKDYVIDVIITSTETGINYVIDTLIKSLNIDKDYVIDTLIKSLNIDKNYVIDTLITKTVEFNVITSGKYDKPTIIISTSNDEPIITVSKYDKPTITISESI